MSTKFHIPRLGKRRVSETDLTIAEKFDNSRIGLLLNHPLSTYYLIMGATMLLLGLGLVMVLSASTIESVRIYGSAYTLVQRQALFAVGGVVALVLSP